MKKIDRRKFLKVSMASAIAAKTGGLLLANDKENEPEAQEQKNENEQEQKGTINATVAVADTKINDDDIKKSTKALLNALGGMEKFVKKGNTVAVKPNIAWDGSPETANNTNPILVAAIVELALQAGAKTVKVFDRPCHNARITYQNSGIAEAARNAGAEVIFAEDANRYKPVNIPDGKELKNWTVFEEILSADVFINVPVAKHHGTTRLTLGIKNLMGVMGGNRGEIHRGDIHQKLADYHTIVKPHLTIIDAIRILIQGGPFSRGTTWVRKPGKIFASTDTVAADACATTVFKKYSGWENIKPEDIGHIKKASEMKLGEHNLKHIELKKAE